jgi:hypothetical protein
MESSPSSRISFFSASGQLIQGPLEGVDCGIALDIPKDSEKASLMLSGRQLPLWFMEDSLSVLSAWPACGPGQYELYLECGDIRERRTVTIRSQHFTEAEVETILHELTNVLPKSIAAGLQKCGGLKQMNTGTKQEPTIEQQYLRLNKAIRGTKERLGILQLLPMIQRECYQVLVARHEVRATNKARRPDMSKLPQAISMPGNVGAGGYLYQLFDQTVERTYETYENRLVKAYVQALQSQLLRLMTRVEEEKAPSAMAAKIQELHGEFHLTCSRTAFLKQVRLPFVSAGRITMVLLKKPAYRAILEDYLALFKQTAIRLEEPRLNNPLYEFPYLYQLWASLKVVKVMLQICGEAGYRCLSHKWVKNDGKGVYFEVMKDFSTAIDLSNPTTGKMVKLIAWSPQSGKGDLNCGQDLPPALAVCVYAAGKQPAVLVFDPKYKVGNGSPASQESTDNSDNLAANTASKGDTENGLSSIEPMPEHIDELRAAMKAVTTPGGTREIKYAAILYPGLGKQIERSLEAISARPEEDEDKKDRKEGTEETTEVTFEKRLTELLSKYLK